MTTAPKVPIFIEALLKPTCRAKVDDVVKAVRTFCSHKTAVFTDMVVNFDDDDFLVQNLLDLRIVDSGSDTMNGPLMFYQVDIQVRPYHLNDEGVAAESDGEITSCNMWMLPAKEFHGLWDSLVYNLTIKQDLLEYATSAMYFSRVGIDPNMISWNRVVLLHGPPGTGKTSLCKALAQKLAIRLSDIYPCGQLIEVNAHSLFSKWFSESGKLVMKLFQKIEDLVQDESVFVCVLIDEVESLTAARQSALSGSEPSDAIRVVNALLTQLDQLKSRPNVLIMTTSNITEAIDLAFVDRADIKQYIGPPSVTARYQILQSCVKELMGKSIIQPAEELVPPERLADLANGSFAHPASQGLYNVALVTEGMSGRALRKLPFLAHALHVRVPTASLEKYCLAMKAAAEAEFTIRTNLAQK